MDRHKHHEELYQEIAERCCMSINDVKMVLRAFILTIIDRLIHHRETSIPVLGIFYVHKYKSHKLGKFKKEESTVLEDRFHPKFKFKERLRVRFIKELNKK